jgi:hypothetical protein
MTARKAVLGFVATLAMASLALPAAAETDERSGKTPEELAIEGMDRLMRALELLIQSIPQYEAPFVDENGDIIIRRRHPRGEPEPRDPTEPPEPAPPGGTST